MCVMVSLPSSISCPSSCSQVPLPPVLCVSPYRLLFVRACAWAHSANPTPLLPPASPSCPWLPQTPPTHLPTLCGTQHPSLTAIPHSADPHCPSAGGNAGHVMPPGENRDNHRAALPSPLGIVELLQQQGISASADPRLLLDSRWARPPSRKGKSVFSLNLVEKLQSLGLDKVAERGLIECEGRRSSECPADDCTAPPTVEALT
ncbi:hypothetical protein Z043_104188 [Scleropages formosus]|uniref:Uncharacterized protein n=1 Tax=Scleropages formosus TaxID=113540 RepID=A0A0P7VKU4_SCLFO|nr:hypothetical protein Z043_104188 [Scleropages formosus]